MSRETMQQALRLIEDEGHKADLLEAASILRAALAEQKCPCGDRPADQCPGEWEPGCDLGANERYVKVAEPERGPGWCDIHQHYKPCEHNTAEQSQPVAWAYECRLSLVTALYSLASDFENALYKFDGHDEALHSANGSIAHARKVAAQWGWNGAAPPAPQPLTETEIRTLAMEVDVAGGSVIEFARAVEAEVLKRMGVQR